MGKISRLELIRNLRKKYRFEYVKFLEEEVQVILMPQGDQNVPIGVMIPDHWRFKVAAPDENAVYESIEHFPLTDNPLREVLKYDSIHVMRVCYESVWVYMVVHSYVANGNLNMTSVFLITDYGLRELICNQNS